MNTNFYRQQTSRSIGENIERELKNINNKLFCQNTDKTLHRRLTIEKKLFIRLRRLFDGGKRERERECQKLTIVELTITLD